MAPETDYLLAVEGLTVSFDGFRAVDDLSFYLDRNDPALVGKASSALTRSRRGLVFRREVFRGVWCGRFFGPRFFE